MSKLNSSQKAKRDFRGSKKWKNVRHSKNVEQNGIDPITMKKLTKYNNCHHLDQREENYQNVDDLNRFVCLNKQTHEVLHILYRYYQKDKDILNRYKYYLDLMIEFSND